MRTIAFDTETTGLNFWTGDRAFTVSAMDNLGEGYLWTFPVNPYTREVDYSNTSFIKEIKEILLDPSNLVFLQNAKFDILMFKGIGIDVPIFTPENKLHIVEVQWLMKYLNNVRHNYQLKPMAKEYLGFPDDDEKDLQKATMFARKLAKKSGYKIADDLKADYWLLNHYNSTPRLKRFWEAQCQSKYSLDLCNKYALQDVERTIALGIFSLAEVKSQGLYKPYLKEMELLQYSMRMEQEGMTISIPALDKASVECEKIVADNYKILCNAYGKEFNPNSNRQLQELLYEGRPHKLVCKHKTESGANKVDSKTLVEYSAIPEVQALFKYKASSKALSTFFNKYKKLGTTKGDVLLVHPQLQQLGTTTHRFSCIEPNLQQASSPENSQSLTKEYLIDIRKVFCPPSGKVWFSFDYSQIEVIVFAALYNVETMITALKNGVNVHTATTNKIWGGKSTETIARVQDMLDKHDSKEKALTLCKKYNYEISEIEAHLGLKNYRKTAKAVTFCKIFGGGPLAIAGWLQCSVDEARKVLSEYDDAFPDINDAVERTISKVKRKGYLISPFGTRLSVERFYEYRIVNHLVQHTAALIMKQGMLKVAKYFESLGCCRLVMTIHDELIIELPKSYIKHSKVVDNTLKPRNRLLNILSKVKTLMEDTEGRLQLPTPVECDYIVKTWSNKMKVEL